MYSSYVLGKKQAKRGTLSFKYIVKAISMKKLTGAIILALLVALQVQAGGSVEQALAHPDRTAADRERDARDHPEIILNLLQIQRGSQVADIFAGSGYYSELIGRIVAPEGNVLLHNNQPYINYVGDALAERFNGRDVPGVIRHDREPEQMDLGESSLDAAMIIMSYHDLFYTEDEWPVIDRDNFMGQIVRALKPGGRFLIVDHAAQEGVGSSVSKTLHRIEESFARADIERYGLQYAGGSDVLRRSTDDHSLYVFDEAIRGNTDRFVLVFTKP